MIKLTGAWTGAQIIINPDSIDIVKELSPGDKNTRVFNQNEMKVSRIYVRGHNKRLDNHRDNEGVDVLGTPDEIYEKIQQAKNPPKELQTLEAAKEALENNHPDSNINENEKEALDDLDNECKKARKWFAGKKKAKEEEGEKYEPSWGIS